MIATYRKLSLTLILGLSSALLSEGALAKGVRPPVNSAVTSSGATTNTGQTVVAPASGFDTPEGLHTEFEKLFAKDPAKLAQYRTVVEAGKREIGKHGNTLGRDCKESTYKELFNLKGKKQKIKCLGRNNPGFVTLFLSQLDGFKGEEQGKIYPFCKYLPSINPKAVSGKNKNRLKKSREYNAPQLLAQVATICYQNHSAWVR